MVRPQGFFLYGQRPPVQGLRLSVLALGSIQFRQIVQVYCNTRVILTKCLLIYYQRPLVQRLGGGILALSSV